MKGQVPSTDEDGWRSFSFFLSQASHAVMLGKTQQPCSVVAVLQCGAKQKAAKWCGQMGVGKRFVFQAAILGVGFHAT